MPSIGEVILYRTVAHVNVETKCICFDEISALLKCAEFFCVF